MSGRGVFKRPYVPTWGRQRTQAEIDLDERLDRLAAAQPAITKDEWARAQYRASSRAGATRQYFEGHFNHSDMVVMDAHVDQMFWQMVRHEMRTNKDFVRKLEFIEGFYEVPQHEFLERIKKRYWAQMQPMTDDPKHLRFLTEIHRAYAAAKEQIADVDPATDERRAQQAFVDREVARQMAREARDAAQSDREYYEQMAMEETLESLWEA